MFDFVDFVLSFIFGQSRAELNRTAAGWPKLRTELYRLSQIFRMLFGSFSDVLAKQDRQSRQDAS